MARLPRYALPGQPQHIISRGNNRSATFVAPRDYQFFLECLGSACERHGCYVHAYVLMTNHVHLLMTPEREAGIGKVMQSVGRRYVHYFNLAYERTGTLWEGRYRATPIDSERYLLTCYRYIELNPVRAGMVEDPRDYPWSSHRANAFGQPDPLVTPHERHLALGTDPETRLVAYRGLFQVAIEGSTLCEIRDATNKGWALGEVPFLDSMENLSQRRAGPLPRGGARPFNGVRLD